MKTRRLIVIIALAIISGTNAYAQMVEATLVDGNPVINCEGMPAGAYTTTSKGNTEAQLKTEAANATLYKRFVVSKVDNHTLMNWSNAFTVCSSLGAGWRLPVQRELILMWILHNELKKASGFTPFHDIYYWCATETNSTNSWAMTFFSGIIYDYIKTVDLRVRCLKEL